MTSSVAINMIQQPTPHLSVSWMELLCDLFLPVVQSQAVWGHDTLATHLFRKWNVLPKKLPNYVLLNPSSLSYSPCEKTARGYSTTYCSVGSWAQQEVTRDTDGCCRVVRELVQRAATIKFHDILRTQPSFVWQHKCTHVLAVKYQTNSDILSWTYHFIYMFATLFT